MPGVVIVFPTGSCVITATTCIEDAKKSVINVLPFIGPFCFRKT